MEHGVATNTRSLFVIVGDKARDQVRGAKQGKKRGTGTHPHRPTASWAPTPAACPPPPPPSHHKFFFSIRLPPQVVNLHYLLSKTRVAARPSVLWCYKKELHLSSHRAKRARQLKKMAARGLLDPDAEDPFSLFVAR